MRSGAVSPPTRAIPSNAPVTTALLEEGSTTRRIARYRGIPRASADSRVEMGTRRNASSEVRATNGIMIVDRAMTPVLGQIDPGQDADRECDHGGEGDEDERALDRVSDAAICRREREETWGDGAEPADGGLEEEAAEGDE